MSLILPKKVAENRRAEVVAESIAKTSRHRLDSDDWATRDHVLMQLLDLDTYLAQRREDEPTYVLPSPAGWKIMVLMLTIPEKTDGGIYIIDDAKEQRALASPQGVVLAMGSGAYIDPDRFDVKGEIEPWCKIGDRITFVKYDASLFQLSNGQRLGFLLDTQPVSVIDEGWEVPT